MTQTADLLVTGASGHLGNAVLTHLIETLNVPAARIAATSRKPGDLGDWAARGVTVRKADYDHPSELAAAFTGIKRLLLISTDALDEPGKRLRQHKAAVDAAHKAGVAHIVYTSLPYTETSLVSFAPDHAGTEAAIKDSGIAGHTLLRNGWYSQNVLHALPHALETGKWFTAAGKGGVSYIARDDLGLAAAAALASDFSGKRTLSLHGEKAWTVNEVAELARNATGKPLEVVQVSVEDLVKGMAGAGTPEPVARVFASFDAAAAAGNLAGQPTDFEALTSRSPQPFAEWFAKNAAPILTEAA